MADTCTHLLTMQGQDNVNMRLACVVSIIMRWACCLVKVRICPLVLVLSVIRLKVQVGEGSIGCQSLANSLATLCCDLILSQVER